MFDCRDGASTVSTQKSEGKVLGHTHQPHREPVVTIVVVLRIQIRIVEVHVVRVVAIVVRSRPIVAVAAHIVDRSPIAVASGRQEDPCLRQQLSFTSCQKNLFRSQ